MSKFFIKFSPFYLHFFKKKGDEIFKIKQLLGVKFYLHLTIKRFKNK